MKICSLCGTPMNDDEQFCTSCGADNSKPADDTAAAATELSAASAETEALATEQSAEEASAAPVQNEAPAAAQQPYGQTPPPPVYGQAPPPPPYGQTPPYGQNPPPYGQTPPPFYRPYVNNAPVTFGNWMLTMLLMCLPVVNIVMLFIWGFGDTEPVSKRNWARAQLIWVGIAFVIFVVLVVAFSVYMSRVYTGFSSYGYYHY